MKPNTQIIIIYFEINSCSKIIISNLGAIGHKKICIYIFVLIFNKNIFLLLLFKINFLLYTECERERDLEEEINDLYFNYKSISWNPMNVDLAHFANLNKQIYIFLVI